MLTRRHPRHTWYLLATLKKIFSINFVFCIHEVQSRPPHNSTRPLVFPRQPHTTQQPRCPVFSPNPTVKFQRHQPRYSRVNFVRGNTMCDAEIPCCLYTFDCRSIHVTPRNVHVHPCICTFLCPRKTTIVLCIHKYIPRSSTTLIFSHEQIFAFYF